MTVDQLGEYRTYITIIHDLVLAPKSVFQLKNTFEDWK